MSNRGWRNRKKENLKQSAGITCYVINVSKLWKLSVQVEAEGSGPSLDRPFWQFGNSLCWILTFSLSWKKNRRENNGKRRRRRRRGIRRGGRKNKTKHIAKKLKRFGSLFHGKMIFWNCRTCPLNANPKSSSSIKIALKNHGTIIIDFYLKYQNSE